MISDDKNNYKAEDADWEDIGRKNKVSDDDLVNVYQKHFDKDLAGKLLVKLRKATRDKPSIIAGPTGAIVSALGKLISALENPNTPTHMKALIVGSIGYIVLPLDLIPDLTPVIGYADDLASVAGVVTAIAVYSDFTLEKLDAFIDEMEKKEAEGK